MGLENEAYISFSGKYSSKLDALGKERSDVLGVATAHSLDKLEVMQVIVWTEKEKSIPEQLVDKIRELCGEKYSFRCKEYIIEINRQEPQKLTLL